LIIVYKFDFIVYLDVVLCVLATLKSASL